MNDKTGGYAYPRRLPNIKVPPDEALELIEKYSGMTLRDWFAGMSMNARRLQGGPFGTAHEEMARLAYADADAMLVARKSGGGQ